MDNAVSLRAAKVNVKPVKYVKPNMTIEKIAADPPKAAWTIKNDCKKIKRLRYKNHKLTVELKMKEKGAVAWCADSKCVEAVETIF